MTRSEQDRPLAERRSRERQGQIKADNAAKTGWPPGMLQDDCKGLSRWFASKPDARQQVRDVCAQIEPASPCFCIGPQNGEPACPCAMRSVKVKDGRYVREIDLGPATYIPTTEKPA